MRELEYKLIVSDFDGTLLRTDDTVSARTKRAIADYKAMGGNFVICTGRMHRSIAVRLPDAELSGRFPLMSYQGTLIRDSESNETLYSHPMDSSLAAEMIDFCLREGIYCQTYDEDNVYTEGLNEYNKTYFDYNRVKPIVVKSLVREIENGLRPMKVLCMNDLEQNEVAYRKLSERFGDRAQVMITARHLVEAVDENGGKGNGLRQAARILGVDMSSTVAVGDEMNDISMIRAAAVGVAMGNAKDSIKREANYVTDTNDDDGVAKLIERIMNCEKLS